MALEKATELGVQLHPIITERVNIRNFNHHKGLALKETSEVSERLEPKTMK